MCFSEVIMVSESGVSHFNFSNCKPTGSRSRPCVKRFHNKCTEDVVPRSSGLLFVHHMAEVWACTATRVHCMSHTVKMDSAPFNRALFVCFVKS